MPTAAVDQGYGTTLTAGTSSWSAQLTSLSVTGLSRAALDTTYMGSGASGTDHGNATFIPSDIIDAGSIEVEGFFSAGVLPPIDAVAETWTITFPDTSTWAASGFMTDFSMNAPFDEKMTFSATIKLTGACNITSVA